MNRVLEIRSYTLKPGTRAQFHALVLSEAIPMLKRWKIDVVYFGPSAHDDLSYVLMRSFQSLDDRQKSQDDFYGSDEWRHGPREGIIALIENYTSFVVPVDATTLEAFRELGGPGQA